MGDTKIYPTTYLDLPTGDGEPMAETEAHGFEMTDYLRDILRDYYADDPMVYVASNNFIYYDASDIKKNISPDCYVIKGIPKRMRDSYQSWAEGGALPCVVFELTSHSTWRRDIGFKRDLYQSWGCHEYFLYDLTADRILGHLLGYRLDNGVYQEIPLTIQGRLHSEELQLELAHHDGHLRFFIPGATQPIATRLENFQAQELRAEQAEQETFRIEQERLQAVAQQVRAEEEREQERLRADRLENRAEQAEQESAREQALREAAQLEIERLREEMSSLKDYRQDD